MGQLICTLSQFNGVNEGLIQSAVGAGAQSCPCHLGRVCVELGATALMKEALIDCGSAPPLWEHLNT